MILAVPLAAILTLATLITIRWFGHRMSHALIAFTAGFLIAGTVAAPMIHSILAAVASAATHAADNL